MVIFKQNGFFCDQYAISATDYFLQTLPNYMSQPSFNQIPFISLITNFL